MAYVLRSSGPLDIRRSVIFPSWWAVAEFMKKILKPITRSGMSRRVRTNRIVISLTVPRLIKVVKGWMMRGNLKRRILLLRLFATHVVRRALRVMLVLETWNDAFVVVERDILL
jgi:hypothetical protein